MNGGELVASVLQAQGVERLFTLVGGHISPILIAAKARGIQVVDTRHEATAVFAADATARLTGRPGVAAVTAGPGVTNTLTAVKNAQMAQSPVVLIGGAAPTALKGRGALQDIDQMSLFTSVVKWSAAARRVKDLVPLLEEAFRQAQTGAPGPVFVETPVDLLYDEAMVREMYGAARQGKSLRQKVVNLYLRRHVDRLFAGANLRGAGPAIRVPAQIPDPVQVQKAGERLRQAQRPVILVGSQATLVTDELDAVVAALTSIGAPVYLSGMARGLLGRDHALQMRHKRRMALKEADFVLLAGVPCDFRLDYGNHIRGSAVYVSANLSRDDLNKNRKPDIGALGDPGLFLRQLALQRLDPQKWSGWIDQLRSRDDLRNAEIGEQSRQPTGHVNPLHLFVQLDRLINDRTILVADGGDFVGTASYILQPPGPLTWLDPGPFGTLGVGAGFALGAKLARPDAEVWIIYGDGSAGYSLSEFDTFVRHNVPVTALVGNDASWAQIAREQTEIFGDDVATVLAHTDYHRVAEGFGGAGLLLDDPELAAETLTNARQQAKRGAPVLINAILGKSDFRKGSISM
ncbi:MAG: thiamine pyrophosphate-binding protein [Anaerolineae bacterium]|nr:thiamine pyrophosphate-binding protein [Anaerolineae bacterium]